MINDKGASKAMPKMLLSKIINQIYLELFMNKKQSNLPLNFDKPLNFREMLYEYIANKHGQMLADARFR